MKRFVTIMVVAILIITGCSNKPTPNNANNINLQQNESEEKTSSKAYSNEENADTEEEKIDANEENAVTDEESIDTNEENSDSDENAQLGEKVYGRVKSIIGNEVELELGNVPDWDGGNGDEGVDDDEKNTSVSMVKVSERENPEGFEDFYAPDPFNPIYGENGEINLTYTGEGKSFTIPAGTVIRNTLGKTSTLDEIKKGSVLMITPKIVDGKDVGIEMLTILK